MIYLDSRVGSRELLPCFKPFGVPVEMTRLDIMLEEPSAGDACWVGNGEHGDCMVGLERKVIGDLVQSMQTKRLSGLQLPGMRKIYPYVVLVVEGIWRPGERGELEVMGRGDGRWWPQRGVLYRQISSFLRTLRTIGGVDVVRTATDRETAVEIVDAWHWWQKRWAEHKSHRAVYAPSSEYTGKKWQWLEAGGRKVDLKKVTAMKVASQLPLVDERSWRVARHFGTVRQMVECGYREVEETGEIVWDEEKAVREWQQALGIKEGRVTVEGILGAMG